MLEKRGEAVKFRVDGPNESRAPPKFPGALTRSRIRPESTGIAFPLSKVHPAEGGAPVERGSSLAASMFNLGQHKRSYNHTFLQEMQKMDDLSCK